MKNLSGFSLLESVVALTILSGLLMIIFSWNESALFGADKSFRKLEIKEVAENFDSDLTSKDLLKNTNGLFDYGAYSVSWKGSIIDQSLGVETNGVPSSFKLALFQIDFEIYRSGLAVAKYRTRKTAYRAQSMQSQ